MARWRRVITHELEPSKNGVIAHDIEVEIPAIITVCDAEKDRITLQFDIGSACLVAFNQDTRALLHEQRIFINGSYKSLVAKPC